MIYVLEFRLTDGLGEVNSYGMGIPASNIKVTMKAYMQNILRQRTHKDRYRRRHGSKMSLDMSESQRVECTGCRIMFKERRRW